MNASAKSNVEKKLLFIVIKTSAKSSDRRDDWVALLCLFVIELLFACIAFLLAHPIHVLTYGDQCWSSWNFIVTFVFGMLQWIMADTLEVAWKMSWNWWSIALSPTSSWLVYLSSPVAPPIFMYIEIIDMIKHECCNLRRILDYSNGMVRHTDRMNNELSTSIMIANCLPVGSVGLLLC